MKVAVVGGGVLGLTLSLRLARRGHFVELFEAAGEIGGLAQCYDFGPFTWDRFYHVILPQDRSLIALLGELGLAGDLRWRPVRTGYYAAGRHHEMTSTLDQLRYPLLSPIDKLRLGWLVARVRFADPYTLGTISAAEWLTRVCGRRVYETFWRPLLLSKFGPFHNRVAASFIWATLTRLMQKSAGVKGSFGYVRGGYRRILEAFATDLAAAGAHVHTGAKVTAIEPDGDGAALRITGAGGDERYAFDQVFFTGPTTLASRLVDAAFSPHVARVAAENPTSAQYLGVICCNVVLRRALTPYYILNIGDSTIPLTGVIEMTNVVDRETETAGLQLVYLPRYLDAASPDFDRADDDLAEEFLGGLRRLFPDLRDDEIVSRSIHRAPWVQPLPLVRAERDAPRPAPHVERPFQLLNTSYLRHATLNNNEVVALVDEFMAANPGL